MTTDLFVPPAAEGLPLAALDSATEGADRLDAAALAPTGRNFLAHALVQLARDGWLRTEPGSGFEPMRDRATPEPEEQPRSTPVSPPPATDRPAVLREAADAVAADTGHIRYGSATDYANRHADLLRRLAAGERDEQQTQQGGAETLPASTAPLAAGFPLVRGNCPACCRAGLFLGTGGYPTCSNHECPEPDAATTVLEQYGHEAHEPEHTWAAELRDPLTDEWVPGTRYVVRERAVNALTHARSIGPTWRDGTPTERRLVRATTTYTVETIATTPATGQPPADTGEEARPRFVRVCVACPECDHTLDENGACENDCRTTKEA